MVLIWTAKIELMEMDSSTIDKMNSPNQLENGQQTKIYYGRM